MKNKLLATIILISVGYFLHAQNQNFEKWNSDTTLKPFGYYSTIDEGGAKGKLHVIRSTDKVSGMYSLRLETGVQGTDTMFGFIIDGDPNTFKGGQKVTLPSADSLIGYYKYSVQTNDSALILVVPKTAGTPTGSNFVYLKGSQTTWKRFSVPLKAAVPALVDSVMFGAVSSDAFNFNGVPGSFLMLDSLLYKSVTGQTQKLVNLSFENWSTQIDEEPVGWTTSLFYSAGTVPKVVVKTTDKISGQYAIELNTAKHNLSNDTVRGMAVLGNKFAWNSPGSGAPINGTNLVGVEFYYKNNILTNDTGGVYIMFKANGSPIHYLIKNLYGTVATYTNYSSGALPSLATADSIEIILSSGNFPLSQAKIDSITFIYTVGANEYLSVKELQLFPNPSSDYIRLSFEMINSTYVEYKITDVTGKIVSEKNLGYMKSGMLKETIDISNMANGSYLLSVYSNGLPITKQFIKQ